MVSGPWLCLTVIFMCVPKIPPTLRQYFVAFWQPFSLWVALFQWLLTSLFTPKLTFKASFPTTILNLSYARNPVWMHLCFCLRRVRFDSHNLSCHLFDGYAIPGFVLPINRPIIPLCERPRPTRADSTIQIKDMAQGALNILQYDDNVGSVAVMLWATTLNWDVHGKKKGGGC
jgi:hypothetical protein